MSERDNIDLIRAGRDAMARADEISERQWKDWPRRNGVPILYVPESMVADARAAGFYFVDPMPDIPT